MYSFNSCCKDTNPYAYPSHYSLSDIHYFAAYGGLFSLCPLWFFQTLLIIVSCALNAWYSQSVFWCSRYLLLSLLSCKWAYVFLSMSWAFVVESRNDKVYYASILLCPKLEFRMEIYACIAISWHPVASSVNFNYFSNLLKWGLNW